MVKQLFSTIFFFGMLLPGFAQRAEVNVEGRRIVRYLDGSWKYLDTEAAAAQIRLSMLEDSLKKVSLALIQARMERLNSEILRAEMSLDTVSENSEGKKKEEDLTAALEEIRQALQIENAAQSNSAESQNAILKNGNSTWSGTLPDEFNLLKNPPKLPCETERSIAETPTGVLFRFTEKTLEPHFQHHDLLVCKAGLVQTEEGFLTMNLILLASTEQAPEIFGSVEQGAVFEILMLRGETLLLPGLVSEDGVWLPGSGAYVWRAVYRLGLKERKKLASSELDKVTFRWSKAEQTFEVFDPDFFIRQLECIK